MTERIGYWLYYALFVATLFAASFAHAADNDPVCFDASGRSKTCGAVNWPDGVRQTFNPDGMTPGLNFGSEAGDPSTPSNGDVWYNSTTGKFRARENGATTNMIGGGSGSGATLVRKTANETVTNSAALQDDDHLLKAIAANETWRFQVEVWVAGPAAGDVKMAFTWPSGATVRWAPCGGQFQNVSCSIERTSAFENSDQAITACAPGDFNGYQHHHLCGFIENGATAGDLRFRWAQATANAGATEVRKDSSMILWKYE